MKKNWDDHYRNYEKLKIQNFLWDRYNWNRYAELLDGMDLKKPKILELGCGSGMATKLLLEKYGGSATVVDYSDKAINLAEKNLENKKVKFIKENIFDLKMKDRFDLVHSQGLIEHFRSKQQIKIIQKHIEFIKHGGLLLLLIPRRSLMFNLYKFCGTALNGGKWKFGYEKPVEPNWIKKIINGFGPGIVKEKKYAIEFGGLWIKK